MIRRTLPAALAGAALLLTGCGSDSDAPTTEEQTAAVQAGEKSAQDAAFEDFVRGEGIAGSDADVQAMIEMAKALCAAYDRGASFIDVVKVATESGFTGYQAGQLNGASIAAYCPQHADKTPGS